MIAIGAILFWAVTYQVNGVSLHMTGLVLMVIGVIGLLWGLLAGATRRHRLP